MSTNNHCPPQKVRTNTSKYRTYFSFIVLGGIFIITNTRNISTGGHRMIGVLAFAIILWMTSAISHPVSATMITHLPLTLLGFSPNPEAPVRKDGHSQCLKAHYFRLFFTSHDSCRCRYVYFRSHA